MSKIAFFTQPDAGHLYPATALGRKLAERGHEVTFVNYATTKAIVRAAGLSFYALSMRSSYSPPGKTAVETKVSTMQQGLLFSTRTVLTDAPEALRACKADGVVADQMDLAAGTVAELLGLPFVSLSIVPPIYLDRRRPPIGFGWSYSECPAAWLRNCLGNLIVRRYVAPALEIINEQRRVWALPPLAHINDAFSRRAIITQMPQAMDFPPYGLPRHLFYTGPFYDGQGRRPVQFPWDQLGSKRLIYASMGTRRNTSRQLFHAIATACAGLDVQLIISQGGSLEKIDSLAGDPVVVPYAPQLEIMSRVSLVITHAGINTTLEALGKGVPLVAIPIADDQPSVAARIKWTGVGRIVPYKKMSVKRLREAVQEVIERPCYRCAAQRMQGLIEQSRGLDVAADLVENALNR